VDEGAALLDAYLTAQLERAEDAARADEMEVDRGAILITGKGLQSVPDPDHHWRERRWG
jgi:hypothetical protein